MMKFRYLLYVLIKEAYIPVVPYSLLESGLVGYYDTIKQWTDSI